MNRTEWASFSYLCQELPALWSVYLAPSRPPSLRDPPSGPPCLQDSSLWDHPSSDSLPLGPLPLGLSFPLDPLPLGPFLLGPLSLWIPSLWAPSRLLLLTGIHHTGFPTLAFYSSMVLFCNYLFTWQPFEAQVCV